MIYARVADGVRAYFAAVNQGLIVAGIDPADITVSVVAPDTTTATTVPASETAGKAGLYTFLVPTAFLQTNGVGVYAVIVEVNSAAPPLRDVKVDVVRVGARNDDDVFNVSQAVLGSVV